jgi:hypothetical protein
VTKICGGQQWGDLHPILYFNPLEHYKTYVLTAAYFKTTAQNWKYIELHIPTWLQIIK